MSLRFNVLKEEMEYFENAESLAIESFLDLMRDLYRDVENGVGIDPESCVCEDSDELAGNLIWLGALFQKIYRNYQYDISRSGASDRVQLKKVSTDLEREIKALQKEKQDCEDMRVQAAAKEKEKRRLEGEIALLKQKLPDLKILENQNRTLELEKDAEQKKWDDAQELKESLTGDIKNIEQKIKELHKEIKEQITPKLAQLGRDLNEAQKKHNGLNEQIQLDDEKVKKLKKQNEDLRRDIDNSDKQGILRQLEEKKTELQREKDAIADAESAIIRYNNEISGAKNEKVQKEAKRNEKKNEWSELDLELAELETEFANLIAAEALYAGKKRRYNSLKTSAEQLRKDSVLLGKRTGMEAFSLEEELERAMSTIGNYFAAVEEAIRKYSDRTEDALQND